jgi:hypothetical protein
MWKIWLEAKIEVGDFSANILLFKEKITLRSQEKNPSHRVLQKSE